MGGRVGRADPAAQAAEALYGAPLASFTAERKRLAVELRQAGDRAAADRVAALAKPSVSAWVVNRIHRDAPGELDELFAVGRRMRAGDLAAAREQRAVLARLHRRAAEILRSDGHAASPAMLRRVATTLQALSAAGSFEPDPPGQLVQDRDPPGFDLLAGVQLTRPDDEDADEEPKPKPKAKRQAAAAAEEPAPSPAERRRQERAAAQRKLLEHRAVQAGRRADERAREVAGLRADLERAEATAERVREALRAAEEALDEARAAADEAARALAEADGRAAR